MMDLVDSAASAAVITELYKANKLIAGICHGPAVLANVSKPGHASEPLLKGHRVTAVSNRECEMLVPVTGIVDPWSVEDAMVKATAGKYEKAEPYTERVVVSKADDGRTVITGQNPASGLALGKAIYEELFGKAYSK